LEMLRIYGKRNSNMILILMQIYPFVQVCLIIFFLMICWHVSKVHINYLSKGIKYRIVNLISLGIELGTSLQM